MRRRRYRLLHRRCRTERWVWLAIQALPTRSAGTVVSIDTRPDPLPWDALTTLRLTDSLLLLLRVGVPLSLSISWSE